MKLSSTKQNESLYNHTNLKHMENTHNASQQMGNKTLHISQNQSSFLSIKTTILTHFNNMQRTPIIIENLEDVLQNSKSNTLSFIKLL